jgi:hypothetical protein
MMYKKDGDGDAVCDFKAIITFSFIYSAVNRQFKASSNISYDGLRSSLQHCECCTQFLSPMLNS